MTLLLLLRSHGGGVGPTPEPPVLVWPLGTANYPPNRRTAVSSFSIKRNDRLPALTATLMDAMGTVAEAPADLSTADSVTFLMRAWPGGEPVIESAGAFVSAAAGTVSYAWAAADTETAGTFACEWAVEWPGGLIATWPSMGYDLVVITEDVDTASDVSS